MIELRSLAGVEFSVIHRAFVEAFSDYVVKMSPTEEQLRDLTTRRGWVADLSCGAYDGDHLVGFTLNGFDGVTGYDTGTGVAPTHRRKGIGARMMEWCNDALRARGAKRYLLEVIDTNTKAIELYRRSGFETTRRLQSWLYEKKSAGLKPGPRLDFRWETWRRWWDFEPSWQNSIASIERAPQQPEVIGDERGYAILFPSNGDLAQFAVARDARRRGIGRHLLDAASTIAGKPLRIMNTDAGNDDVNAFLEACGARRFVAQLEMVAPVSS